jgi:hypothetical protein
VARGNRKHRDRRAHPGRGACEESTLPVSTHIAFDVAFAVALALSAVTFALSGDAMAAAFLGPAALALIVLMSFTRYSSPSHAG